jgi:hypothetical protein
MIVDKSRLKCDRHYSGRKKKLITIIGAVLQCKADMREVDISGLNNKNGTFYRCY